MTQIDRHRHTHIDGRANNIRYLSFITKYDMLGKNEQFLHKCGQCKLQKRPQVADGGLQTWRVAANKSTSSLGYLTRGGPPDWELGIKTVNKQNVT
jgi:hypothetical protein